MCGLDGAVGAAEGGDGVVTGVQVCAPSIRREAECRQHRRRSAVPAAGEGDTAALPPGIGRTAKAPSGPRSTAVTTKCATSSADRQALASSGSRNGKSRPNGMNPVLPHNLTDQGRWQFHRLPGVGLAGLGGWLLNQVPDMLPDMIGPVAFYGPFSRRIAKRQAECIIAEQV